METTDKIYDCQGEETEFLKYGDIFTVSPESPGLVSRSMAMDGERLKKFRLVPGK